jgi:murein DD-endopeptidase MepM/ murein hydrolase activator NlpD
MNFDQVGKQHVSKRRRPSPVRNVRRSSFSPSSLDASFSQQIWPRQDRSSRRTGSHAGGHAGTIFTGKSRKLFSGAHKRDRTHITEAEQNLNDGISGQGRSSAGFSISMTWLHNLAVVAGVLVIGIIGMNWNTIADSFKLNRAVAEVSPKTDPDGYTVINGEYSRSMNLWETDLPENTVESAVGSAASSREEMTLNLTETFYWTEYKVKKGDTISGIGSQHSVSSGSIIAFNNIKEAWNLRIGTALKIPSMNGIPYTVQKGDNLSKIAEKMKVPQNAIADANNLPSSVLKVGEVLFIPGAMMDANELKRAISRQIIIEKPMIFPAGGRITSGYGWREDPVRPRPGEKTFHKAVDIAGKTGDPVKAAMQGTVLNIDSNPSLGNFIILGHGEYQTLYAHLSAYSVKKGEEVKQGQEIGKIGNTGYTTGPHLHFEVFHKGNRINPLEVFK